MINIVQGEDRLIVLSFSKDGGAYSLAGATEVTVRFPGTNGLVEKLLSDNDVEIIDAPGGIMHVTLDNDDTAGLKVKRYQTIEVEIAIGPSTRIFQIERALNVARKIAE